MAVDMTDLQSGLRVQGVGGGDTSPTPVSIAQTAPLCTSLDDLRADIDELGRLGVTDAYRTKQLHRIPVAPVVDRVQYILRHCQGKRVLHLGCGWPPGYLHQALEQVAARTWGVDLDVPEEEDGKYHGAKDNVFWRLDLDSRPITPAKDAFDIIVCAEILEHLANPGNVLDALMGSPVLITVPNAFSAVGRHHLTGGVENVHVQHCAWYSYTTLKELVTRYGYQILEHGWYNCPRGAQPQESEGLIFLVR